VIRFLFANLACGEALRKAKVPLRKESEQTVTPEDADLGITGGSEATRISKKDLVGQCRNCIIITAPTKNNTADRPNAACTENALHKKPTIRLDTKSPPALTAASVPNAIPC
jgi:hypothetical protein